MTSVPVGNAPPTPALPLDGGREPTEDIFHPFDESSLTEDGPYVSFWAQEDAAHRTHILSNLLGSNRLLDNLEFRG